MKVERISNVYPQKWAQIIILGLFCLFLFFFNLNRWDLWNPDEPRYAQVAREMVQSRDWILMHFNGKVYADKPPLFFWLIALSSYLWQGFSSFSVRFPSAVFGTLTVLLTFLLGKNLYSSRTGFIAGLILATSIQFTLLSTRANIDTTLTFFITGSIFCFLRYQLNTPLSTGESKWPGESWRKFLVYGFYISMALATLAKGPVGFILPLLVVLSYLSIQRDWNGIKRMKFFSGMLLFLVIVLSWYIPAILKGGQAYLNETLLRHSIDRFAKGSSHIRPIYYYFYNFPLDFLPWFIFLPAGIAYGFSEEVIRKRKEFLFLLIWSIVIFIFFSLSKGKRGIYLLPLFPATSLIVGKLWDDFISARIEKFRQEWISFGLFALTGLVFITGAGIPWVVSMKFPSFLHYSLPIAFLMVGGGLTLFVLNRFKMQGAIFFFLIGMMAGGFFYTLRVIFPVVNHYKSARFLSQEITSRIKPGERLASYGDFVIAPYNYYTGIVPILEIEKEEEFIRFLQSDQRVFCLMKFRDFVQFQTTEDRPRLELINRRDVGGDDMVVVSNRKDEENNQIPITHSQINSNPQSPKR